MAVAVANEICGQYDFVPDEILSQWVANNYVVGGILAWLQIPNDIGNALLMEIEVHAQDHVSVTGFITPAERETMLAQPACF